MTGLEDRLRESMEQGVESDTPPRPKLDFRKLSVWYKCLAQQDQEEECIYYTPGSAGRCAYHVLGPGCVKE